MIHLDTPIDSDTFKNQEKIYDLASVSVSKSAASKNDDVVYSRVDGLKPLLLIADGATGFGYGHIASNSFRDFIVSAFSHTLNARQMKSLLFDADFFVRNACVGDAEGSDTTGVIMTLDDGRIEGASVGDSQAFVFGTSTYELTSSQRRRPRIGNGGYPQDFTGRIASGDVLVVATDGLWNRIDADEVGRICLASDGADQAVAKLLARAKTADGKYDDDVSIIVVVAC